MTTEDVAAAAGLKVRYPDSDVTALFEMSEHDLHLCVLGARDIYEGMMPKDALHRREDQISAILAARERFREGAQG